jgi:hypothetical protein
VRTIPVKYAMSTNKTGSSAFQSPATMSSGQLNEEMKKLATSDNPVDIATLAYIWGYPLVIKVRTYDYAMSPNIPPGPLRGPVNTIAHARDLLDASYTDVVRPNQDTLYSVSYLDLMNKSLILQVPPMSDRYYVLQFTDAYTNSFKYIGTRTNVTSGGTYFITGPNWTGTVPSGMLQIKSPTNLAVLIARILVNGPTDVPNVRALQDKLSLSPISATEGSPIPVNTSVSKSEEIPVSSQPAFMPTTGAKIFDELSNDMIDNPPFQDDAGAVAKFEMIGIGPGLTPSTTKNETILKALEQGIIVGEKMIDEKIAHLGSVVNGWSFNLDTGNYGSDYLLRAAVAKTALGANAPEEALYPLTFVDNSGNNLTGSEKYVIHFDKDKIPPVEAFWSITMYNSKYGFVDNPINRYAIGDRTPGFKFNSDGSFDIYVQKDNPGKEKESNWLPATPDNFSLLLRLYIPKEIVLKGEYQYPQVQRVS